MDVTRPYMVLTTEIRPLQSGAVSFQTDPYACKNYCKSI